MLRGGRLVALIVVLVVLAAIGIIAALRDPIAAALLPKLLGSATGTDVRVARIEVHASHASLAGVTIRSRSGEAIAYVPRIEVTYNLHDLLPGSTHRYGLRSIVVDDPHITIVHHRDGTYNLPKLATQAKSARPSAPFNLQVVVRNGTVTLTDETRVRSDARHLAADRIDLNAHVNTGGTTSYRASLAYDDNGRQYPIAGSGRVGGGVNLQHWSAALLPLPRLIDYGANNAAVHALSGRLAGIDVQDAGVLTAAAKISDLAVAVKPLRAPLREGQGEIVVTSQGATVDGFTASLNGVPLQVTGGITNLRAPQLHVLLRTRVANIHTLTAALAQTARLPASGSASAAILAEGPLRAPIVLIAMRSPRFTYNGVTFTDASTRDAFTGGALDLLHAQLRYGSATLQARGHIALRSEPGALNVLAQVQAPSIGVRASALATANDLKHIAARGVFSGKRAQQLGGTFVANSRGDGAAVIVAENYPLQARGARGLISGALTASKRGSAVRADAAVALANGEYRTFPIVGAATLAYAPPTLQIEHGLAALGPALALVQGSVGGLRFGKALLPAYDLDARVRAADLHALVAMAQPKLAREDLQGSVDAQAHISGSGSAPVVAGTIAIPEGAVHGLAFRRLSADVAGGANSITVRQGSVRVGTTTLAFRAAMKPQMQLALGAPHANLADFNDYFDTGDTLAGNGRLALSIQSSSTAFRTDGGIALSGVRYRRFPIGRLDASWRTRNNTIAANLAAGGSSGHVTLSGTASAPVQSGMNAMLAQSDVNIHARVQGLDLGTWLPLLGYTGPVTGHLNAAGSVRGRFPDETLDAQASLAGAHVGRVPIQTASLSVSAQRGRGTLRTAALRIPNLAASGSGTFGLHAHDPLQLTLHATSPDLGALMQTFTGKPSRITGAMDTTLSVGGTRLSPLLNDTLALANLRDGAFALPRASAQIAATRTQVTVRNGLVQLPRGSVALAGAVPISVTPHVQLDPRNRPVRFTLGLNDVDFSSFASALPSGTRLAGTMSGVMNVNGTLDAPQLLGSIALHNGYFVGPWDQNPISHVDGTLQFSGNTVTLQNVGADVGSGRMTLAGSARLPNVRNLRAATFSVALVAHNAQVNNPKYFRGTFNADVTASRASPTAVPQLAGTFDLPSARIPLSAFWNPKAPQGPKRVLPDVALNMRATVGNDVRVQSSNVDVGAQGFVHVGGTLPSPQLRGRFTSTGGTVSFFRTFTIENALVRFQPANGIMPLVNATASTQVSDPLTYIALNVRGLAPSNMQLTFSSDPQYSEQQIMGLLAGIGGPSGPALAGAGTFSANSVVENFASGEINGFFTRQMLEPLSAALGSALGLQNLQISDSFNSGFGVSAAKAFGKHLTAVYAQSLGQPRRQSLSIKAHRGLSTAFDLMVYQVQSPTLLGFEQTSSLIGFDNGAQAPIMQPNLGNSGVSFSYEHQFY